MCFLTTPVREREREREEEVFTQNSVTPPRSSCVAKSKLTYIGSISLQTNPACVHFGDPQMEKATSSKAGRRVFHCKILMTNSDFQPTESSGYDWTTTGEEWSYRLPWNCSSPFAAKGGRSIIIIIIIIIIYREEVDWLRRFHVKLHWIGLAWLGPLNDPTLLKIL